MSAEDPTPAEYGLDGPPATDEGVILSVEHDETDDRYIEAPYKECQACGAAVDRREPHTTAFIRIEAKIGPQHKRPVFCGPDCWRAFATADSDCG